jgi:hypothetical protein
MESEGIEHFLIIIATFTNLFRVRGTQWFPETQKGNRRKAKLIKSKSISERYGLPFWSKEGP